MHILLFVHPVTKRKFQNIKGEKVEQLVIMGFPIGNLLKPLDLYNKQIRKHISCLKIIEWLPAKNHKKQNLIS